MFKIIPKGGQSAPQPVTPAKESPSDVKSPAAPATPAATASPSGNPRAVRLNIGPSRNVSSPPQLQAAAAPAPAVGNPEPQASAAKDSSRTAVPVLGKSALAVAKPSTGGAKSGFPPLVLDDESSESSVPAAGQSTGQSTGEVPLSLLDFDMDSAQALDESGASLDRVDALLTSEYAAYFTETPQKPERPPEAFTEAPELVQILDGLYETFGVESVDLFRSYVMQLFAYTAENPIHMKFVLDADLSAVVANARSAMHLAQIEKKAGTRKPARGAAPKKSGSPKAQAKAEASAADSAMFAELLRELGGE